MNKIQKKQRNLMGKWSVVNAERVEVAKDKKNANDVWKASL